MTLLIGEPAALQSRLNFSRWIDMRIWAWCREGLTEAAKFAADHGITLALQDHPPVIGGYRDVLRIVGEVGAHNLKVCFDTRLEHEMSPTDVLSASREIGPLHVLSHYGNEYEETNELAVPQVDGGCLTLSERKRKEFT
jgi:sugar phosphate isomerase/epimerase